MNKKITIISDQLRLRPKKSEVQRLLASNEKAKKLLNWSPSYGYREGFARGIEQTIEWFINPKNLRAYKFDRYNI